jgi:hypothetical protein
MDLEKRKNIPQTHKRLLKSPKVDVQKVDVQKVDVQKKKASSSVQKLKECNPNYNKFSVLSE